MRILFLGNDYNAISVACLDALVRQGRHDIHIAAHDPGAGPLHRTLPRILRRNGLAFVARKTVRLVVASARVRLRALGVPLRGCTSLRELVVRDRLPYLTPRSINAPETLDRLRALDLDLIVVAAYSQILKPPILAIPRHGCINVHPSLLPRYRGPNPFYWVLAQNETRTGVTIHHVDAGIDSGDIILQESFAIEPGTTEHTLLARSLPVAASLLTRAVDLIERGDAPRTPQKSEDASYFSHPPRGASRL